MPRFAATIRDISPLAVRADAIPAGGFNYYLAGDADLPAPAIFIAIIACTPLQFQRALLSMGLLDTFLTFAQTEKVAGRRTLQLTLDRGIRYESTDPVILAAAASLSVPGALVTAVFNLAVTL